MIRAIRVMSFVSLLAVIAPTGAFAATEGFTQNLRQGMAGTDVFILQAFLNVNPQTGYFGPLTFKAVTAFQKSYGITPTGTVGPLTRAKLNGLIKEPVAQAGARTGAPSIVTVTPLNLPAGNKMTISGRNLGLPGSTIKLGTRVITDITQTTKDLVTFKTPADLAPGQYYTTVTDSAGNVSNAVRILILKPAGTAQTTGAKITKITPAVATYGTLMTIEGTGFIIGSNTIEVSYAVLENVQSADGTHLTFITNPPIPRWGADPKIEKVPWELWVRLNNNGEISNEVSYNFNPF